MTANDPKDTARMGVPLIERQLFCLWVSHEITILSATLKLGMISNRYLLRQIADAIAWLRSRQPVY
jgi:hypothetical protein